MKLSVAVAALSLLATPVAFAQTAPRSVPIPTDGTPKPVVKDADFYESSHRDSSEAPHTSEDADEGALPHSASGTKVQGSFEGSAPADVETTFQGANTGS